MASRAATVGAGSEQTAASAVRPNYLPQPQALTLLIPVHVQRVGSPRKAKGCEPSEVSSMSIASGAWSVETHPHNRSPLIVL